MIRKQYVILCVLLILFALMTLYGLFMYNNKDPIQEKFVDYEVRHYNITAKDVIYKTIDSPYNCYIASIDKFELKLPEIQAQAKGGKGGGSSKGSSGSSKGGIKFTPKPNSGNSTTPYPRSNNRIKNGDKYEYDQDIAPDDNLTNPIKPRAPSGKKWLCSYRQEVRYDYVVTDSDDSKYIFGTNLLTSNENPDNWNKINIGDPVAKIVEYENYFLAGTDPVFSPMKNLPLSYQTIIKDESKTYGTKNMQIDQVFQTSDFYSKSDLDIMNKDLMLTNAFLNNKDNKKQVNLQLFFIKEDEDDYLRQLCVHRDGCNKNDLILTIQLNSSKEVKRIQGYSWSPTGFEIATQLDSDLTAKPNSINNQDDFNSFLERTKNLIKERFIRKEMSEFKYIKDSLLLNNKKQ
ncbi:MAG: hypothetical protein ACRCXZ_02910 [Patescibacteria group bacterium]